jgi:hypothetical protein
MALQDVIDQVQAVVRAVSGMVKAPDEPPDQLNQFPFAVCYAGTGDLHIGPPEVMHGMHTLVLEVHVARRDLTRDVQRAMPFVDTVPAALFAAYAAGTLTALDAMGHIRYEFRPLGWGGVATLGFRFWIDGVKVQDTL